MTDLERAFALYLWRSSLGERLAVGVFWAASRWDWLPPELRARAASLAEEEAGHGDFFRAAARQYLPVRPVDLVFPSWPWGDPILGAATVHAAERFAISGLRRMAGIARGFGVGELARDFERIAREETGHIAWGRDVLRAIRAHPVHGPRLARWSPRGVAAAYRDVSGDRRWMQGGA